MSAVPLAYEVFGDGPPLLILHGLFGAARNWQGYAKRLSIDYQVITVDLRNHGRSPRTDTHSYTDLAADVALLIDTLALDKVRILGHSMGGKAAMTFALDSPTRVTQLIVVDIAPVAYADQHTLLIDAMLEVPLADLTRRLDADRHLAATVLDPAVRQLLLQNLVFDEGVAHWRLNLPTLRRAMPQLIGPLPVAADAHYAGDVAVIRGGRSDRVTCEHLPILAHFFPAYTLHTISRGGHWPHAEAPAEFAAVLSEVLNAAPGTKN